MPVIRGTEADQEDRERQSQQPPPPSPTEPGFDFINQGTQESPTDRGVGIVEKASSGKLPTDVVITMAGLGYDDKELTRLARQAARWVDVPYTLSTSNDDPYSLRKAWKSPEFRKNYMFEDAMRSMDLYEPAAIYQVLQTYIEKDTEQGRTHSRGGKEIKKLTPGRLGAAVEALRPIWRDEIDLQTGLGIIVQVAKGYNPKQFSRNLATIKEWVELTQRQGEFGPMEMAGLAMALSDARITVRNRFELAEALAGGLAERKAAEQAAIEAPTKQVSDTTGLINVEVANTYDPEHDSPQDVRGTEAIRDIATVTQADIDMKLGGKFLVRVGDLQQQIEDIEAKLEWQDDPLKNTWFGRNIAAPVDKFFDQTQNLGYRALIEGSTLPVVAINAVQGVLPGGGDSVESQVREALDERHRAIFRLNFSQEYRGMPSLAYAYEVHDEWWAPAFDFVTAWYTDPLNIIGGVGRLKNLRMARPGLTDSIGLGTVVASRAAARSDTLVGWADAYNAFRSRTFQKAVTDFSNSKIVDRLFKSLNDPASFTARIRGLRTVYEHGGLDETYMLLLREEILRRYPNGGPRALEEFKQGIISHFTQWGPEASSANVALARRIGAESTAEQAMLAIDDGSLTPANLAQFGPMSDPVFDAIALPLRAEVPRAARPIPGLGLRKAQMIRNIERSPEGSLGRELMTLNPGRVFNIEDGAIDYVRANMERAGIPTDEIAEFQSRMARAITSDVAREDTAFAIVDEMNERIFRQKLIDVFGEKGVAELPQGVIDELHGIVFTPYKALNTKPTSFGVVPREIDTTLPRTLDDLNKTQRKKVISYIRKNRKESELFKGLDFEARKELDRALKRWVEDTSLAADEVADIARRMGVSVDTTDDIWNAAGIPAYREMTKPILASNLRNIQHVPDPVDIEASIRTYVGITRQAKATLLRSLGKELNIAMDAATQRRIDVLFGRAANRSRSFLRSYRRFWKAGAVARPAYVTKVILLDENARFIATRGLMERFAAHRMGPFGRMLDNAGAYDVPVRTEAGETIATLGRSGSERIPYEPAAASKLREQELMDEVVRRAGGEKKAWTPTGGYAPLTATQPGHLENWVSVLRDEFASTEAGAIALASIRDGRSVKQTADALHEWGTGIGANTRRTRIGIADADVRQWANDTAAIAHYTTLESPEIAELALKRVDPVRFGKHLERTVPTTQRPVVSGLLYQASMQENPGSALANWAYRHFVSQPEDVLNRQPYFRSWKRAAEGVYWDVVQEQYRVPRPQILNREKEAVEIPGLAPQRPPATPIQGYTAEGALSGRTLDQVPVEADYVYHVTREDTIAGKLRRGIIRRSPDKPDTLSYLMSPEDKVWFADTPEHAFRLADNAQPSTQWMWDHPDITPGPPVVLRVKRSSVDDLTETLSDEHPGVEFWSRRDVGVEKVEYWGEDNKWHPLSDLAEPPTPRLDPLDPGALGPRPTVGDEAGYVYHVTPPGNFPSIRAKGVEARLTHPDIPAGTFSPDAPQLKPRAFVATSPQKAIDLAHTNGAGDVVLLRVRAEELGDTTPEMFKGSQFTFDDIPPEKLEFLGADGVWHSLTGTPEIAEITRAVDIASNRFALSQVRRIMFDATKQQRILELMTPLFPFPQPFFEGYTAWGHIMFVRNPQTLSHVRQIFNFAVQSGVIEKNENDEWIIPWHPVMGALWLADKIPGIDIPDPWKQMFTMRLSSLNMLSSTTVQVAPGISVPAPGADVLVSNVMQWAFKNSSNDAAVSYFLQFGSSTPLIPFPLEAAARLINPESFAEDDVARMTLQVMRDMQFKGLDRNADGTPVPYNEFHDQARAAAEQLVALRAAAALLGPASPSVQWEYQPLLDELNELRDEMGFSKGTDAFNKKYDYKYTMLTIGTTEFTPKAGEDPVVDALEGTGREIPRVPASEFVAKLLSTPEGKDFMKNYPAWFGLLLAGVNSETANRFSFPYYARQYEQKLLNPADPLEFWGDAQSAQAWPEYITWRDGVGNVLYEKWQREGGSYESDSYLDYKVARQEKLSEMWLHYPGWADRYLKEVPSVLGDEAIAYDWKYDDPDLPPPTIVVAQARTLIENPEFAGLPGIEVLRDYFDERDKIAEIMDERGYTDIRQPSAEEDGLTARYDRLWSKIEKQNPESFFLLNSYFEGDLTGLQDRRLETYRGPNGPAVSRFNEEWQALRREQQNYEFEYQFFSNMQDTQEWLNQQYATNRKTMEVWFNTEYPEGTPARREYVRELAFKPPEFMSAFELHVLGLDVSPEAAEAISTVGQMRNRIAKIEHFDPNFEEGGKKYETQGDLYDDINAFVNARTNPKSEKYDKTFAEWVEAANSWSWGIKSSGLTKQPGKTGDAWADIAGALDDLQGWADSREMTGPDTFDTDANKRDYQAVRRSLMEGIEDYFFNKDSEHYAPAFKHQWYDIQKAIQGSLIETLMPGTYFKLGE